MESILNKKSIRGTFYLLIFLFFLNSSIIRFFVLPRFNSELEADLLTFIAMMLDGFSISLLVTVLIGGFVFWMKPEIVKRSVMDVVDPKEIGPLLKRAASDSRSWVYKGACGRYMRATTLPMMATSASQQGIGKGIRLTLINPINNSLCEEYATYRRSLKSAKNSSEWTDKAVKEEVISTVISALRYKHEEPLLRIEIHLIDHFSAFRFDISDEYVIVTKEDSEAAGLRADSSTYFYDSYVDDSRLSERQSKKITFSGKIPLDGDLTKQNLEELIQELELVDEHEVEVLDLDKVIRSINCPEDPYS